MMGRPVRRCEVARARPRAPTNPSQGTPGSQNVQTHARTNTYRAIPAYRVQFAFPWQSNPRRWLLSHNTLLFYNFTTTAATTTSANHPKLHPPPSTRLQATAVELGVRPLDPSNAVLKSCLCATAPSIPMHNGYGSLVGPGGP